MNNPNHLRFYPIAVGSILVIALTLLATWAFMPSQVQAATPEPDRIATGVAEGKAIAATLTADAPVIDRIATGVAEAKAIAATLTAEGPLPAQTCVPEKGLAATATATKTASKTATVSAEENYGATKHCPAKTGYSTIELRNIVANVKSLNLFVDGVLTTSVPFGKYDCIYLEDGKYVFQWKNDSEQKQSNARSFTVKGSDGWYSGSKRSDGARNPYDAWLDVYKPTKTLVPTTVPSSTPTPP